MQVILHRQLFHLVTSYHPDIVLCSGSNKVALLELACPLDSVEHLKSARVRKQEKREYQELQSEFDRLGIPCSYNTIELSVLGHYLPDSLVAFLKYVLTSFKMRSRFLNPPVEGFLT